MQRFAFHRKAQRLRDQALMWRIIVTLDSLGIAGVGLLIIKPYNYVTITAAALWMVLLWWVAGLPLRRYHTLTETTLTLVGGYTSSFTILRDQIDSAERFIAPLPQGVAPVGIRYIPREDTLYILPDKKNLVCVTLSSPATGKVPPRMVEFTRVVCMVDEPDAFIAAVAPGTRPAQGDRPQPVTTKKQEAGPSAINDTRGDDTVIEMCNLTKQFGDFTAVNALSLRVARGEIFGFLGSNGAGKSTTMKMLVGLLRPTSGQILILGKDPWNDLTARQQVGYVPDSPMLYENLTAQEHLWLVGGLYDLPEKEARSRALDLLGQLGLTRFADQQIRSYSLGMKRKLAIASALMHQPPILLLDEATNGLDPRAAREVKDFIRAAADSGTTIFLTTHLLDVVSELAHRVAIIHEGSLQISSTLTELRHMTGRPDASLEELFLLTTDRSFEEASAR